MPVYTVARAVDDGHKDDGKDCAAVILFNEVTIVTEIIWMVVRSCISGASIVGTVMSDHYGKFVNLLAVLDYY